MSHREALAEHIRSLTAVDHHCHGVVRGDLPPAAFVALASESDHPPPPGLDVFDSPLGAAIRAHCAPVLGLPKHADATRYLAARDRLGSGVIARRLLGAAGIGTFLVDTGHRTSSLLDPEHVAALSGGRAHEIVRLEAVAERVAADGVGPDAFADVVRESLGAAVAAGAAGFKSIIAYRVGLDFDPARPSEADVRQAAGRWLDTGGRLEDPVLLRALLWWAIDLHRPLQMHVGFGDSDIVLPRCDPAAMTGFLRATVTAGTPIMLLHNYPFLREAAYLAHVYPHVYLDTSAVVGFTGASSVRLVRDALELAPFGKLLFATDAFGLPELYLCGSVLFRRGLADVFGDWLERDDLAIEDARRYAGMIMSGNAQRVYELDPA